MDDERWPPELMRAVLPLAVLRVVGDEETYGYVIARRLEAAGLGRVKGGTLYPVLARLEADGLVRSQWREGDGGPGRKYFAITAGGRTALDRRATRWRAFCRLTTDLLEGQGSQEEGSREGNEAPT